jgi:5-methylcytosine-specific restriction endonuclease McrA
VSRLVELANALRDEVAGFDADRWSADACASVAETLAAASKACSAAAARAATRAVAGGAHRGRGFTSGVEWMARVAGVTPAEARTTLATVAAIEKCPATRHAVASGVVSLVQAREIARAEQAVAGSEDTLLQVAATASVAGLRDESRRVVLETMDRDELCEHRRRARSVQHWIDEFGMVAGRFRLPPEVGVPFVNRLDRATDRARRDARRAGVGEARDAHAADALVSMVAGTSAVRSGRADVVFVCSLDAYRRGHTHGDELCHVIGSGPVSVAVVREQLRDDAFVKAVVVRGKRIDVVAHFGRKMPAELRTALELGDPERLDGAVCAEEGCDRRYGLEWDHVDPIANGGVTSYENINALCEPDHWAKTERDRKAGLLDGGRAPPR